MKELRIIERSLRINDPMDTYIDPENKLLQQLREIYEGKCVAGCFVERVVRIVKCSPCKLVSNFEDDFGSVDLQFEAEVTIYLQGEILNNCEVINKEANLIMAKAPNTYIFMQIDKSNGTNANMFASVSKGQKISVRVGRAKYTINATHISVNAIPFIANRTCQAWEIKSNLSKEDANFLKPMLDKLIAELELCENIKKVNPKGWDHFAKLLHTFADQDNAIASINKKDSHVTSIIKLAKLEEPLLKEKSGEIVYLSHDNRLPLHEPNVVITETLHPNYELNTNLAPRNAILHALQDSYNYAKTVRELTETYINEEYKRHINIWKIIEKQKFTYK